MVESSHAMNFNVQKYREMALKAIRDVQKRGHVPIVCGGTNYYIEALLFAHEEALINPEEEENKRAHAPAQVFDKLTFEIAFD